MALPQKDQKVQDAVSGSWVDTIAPHSWRPYLRLSRFDRPVGAWLLFLPCVFGAAFAASYARASILDTLHFVLVCMMGAWLMRGAGCTWNDIVDRHIDAQVERTKSRPIPSGAVSVYFAGIWMAVQMVSSLMALVTLEPRTIVTAIASLVIVAIYPFAKRFTNWPQIVLGLAFNWGVIIAYVELASEATIGMFALYVAAIFWTLFYDTIYAFQDIRDDETIGVKSTARVSKGDPKRYLGAFAGAAFLLISTAIVFDLRYIKMLAMIGFFAGAFAFLIGVMHQLRNFDAQNPKQCLQQFRGNVRIGQITGLIWMLAYVLEMYG